MCSCSGPALPSGSNVMMPLVLMLALVTTPPVSAFVTASVYVSDNAGMSLSVAAFVTVSNVSSFTTWLLTTPNTGPL